MRLSEHHQQLNEHGVGKCSVPMWSGGMPAGFCDCDAYGPQEPGQRRYGEFSRGKWFYGYCSGLACYAHGGPAAPAEGGEIADAETELRDCPFCGGRDVDVVLYNRACVVCRTCDADGPSGSRYTLFAGDNLKLAQVREEAAALWNRREPPLTRARQVPEIPTASQKMSPSAAAASVHEIFQHSQPPINDP